MLDLVRLGRARRFQPGDENLYRHIALITELGGDQSVLDVPCGRGTVPEFFALNYEVEASGVDPDPEAIADAEDRAKTAGLMARLHFQNAPVEDLPYQDEVFDIAIGELGIAASQDPFRAVTELSRVTKPMGTIALIALNWTGHVDEQRREVLIQHLGASPMVLVEWKRALREANVVDLHVEDWSDEAFPFLVRGRSFTPLAELSSLFDKVSILHRAWRRWGWRGLKGAISREHEVRKLLGTERTIGVTLIRGRKWDGRGDQD
jgi:ubiquinone/menaquinone biosynthesis C-methylase UbiE